MKSSSGQGSPLYMTSGLTTSTRSRASCLHASLDHSREAAAAAAAELFEEGFGVAGVDWWQSLKMMELKVNWLSSMAFGLSTGGKGEGRFPEPMRPAWNTVEVPVKRVCKRH